MNEGSTSYTIACVCDTWTHFQTQMTGYEISRYLYLVIYVLLFILYLMGGLSLHGGFLWSNTFYMHRNENTTI